jgi:hypothetical protein
MDMNQENINQALGLGAEEVPQEVIEEAIEEVIEEVAEEPEEPEYSEDELKAMDQGWTRKDEFKGNPDNWKPAKQFLEWGEMRDTIKQLKDQNRQISKSVDERLENNNKIWRAQLEAKNKELEQQFNRAVEEGDIDAATAARDQQHDINNQIANIAPPQEQQNDQAVIAEFNYNNAWLFENTPRAQKANARLQLSAAKGMSLTDTIEDFNQWLATEGKEAPVNPNRNTVSSVASSAPAPRQKKERSLSMGDLSSEERKLRVLFADDKTFLKSVQDMRKGA